MGIQVNRFYRHRVRQNVHIPVVDGTTVSADLGGSGLITQCLTGIIAVIGNHQVIEPYAQGNKCQQSQHSAAQHDSSLLPGIRPYTASMDFPCFHLVSALPYLNSDSAFKWAARETLAAHCSSYSSVSGGILIMQTNQPGRYGTDPNRWAAPEGVQRLE